MSRAKRRAYVLSIAASDNRSHVETRAFGAGESAHIDFVEGGVFLRPQMFYGSNETATVGPVEGIDFPGPPRAYGTAVWWCRCRSAFLPPGTNDEIRRFRPADMEQCPDCGTYRPRSIVEPGT